MTAGSAFASTCRARMRPWLATERAGGLDEVPGAQGEALAADDARHRRPRYQADDQRGVEEARPEERHHDEDEEERRHRHEHVGHAHDRRVHCPRRSSRPRRPPPCRRRWPAPSPGSRSRATRGPPHDPPQDVAPEPVRAEPVRGASAASAAGGATGWSSCRARRPGASTPASSMRATTTPAEACRAGSGRAGMSPLTSRRSGVDDAVGEVGQEIRRDDDGATIRFTPMITG